MGRPGSQAHPAELILTGLVLTEHVVTASVLFNDGATFGTLLGVGGDPVARLAVVVALLDPFLDQMTLDRVMPVLTAVETEAVVTSTFYQLGSHMLRQEYDYSETDINPDPHLNLDSITTMRTGAPLEKSVTLHEAIGDEVLVLELDLGVCDEGHHCLVIHHDVAGPGALDHLRGALVHDLGGEVLSPAMGAEQMATLETSHHLPRQRQAADVTVEDRGPGAAARPL